MSTFSLVELYSTVFSIKPATPICCGIGKTVMRDFRWFPSLFRDRKCRWFMDVRTGWKSPTSSTLPCPPNGFSQGWWAGCRKTGHSGWFAVHYPLPTDHSPL